MDTATNVLSTCQTSSYLCSSPTTTKWHARLTRPPSPILLSAFGPDGDAERKRVGDFAPKSFTGLALWIMRGYRPDIAYQVGALSRVAHCFNDKHIDAARHLLRYLRTTKDLQLVYKRNLESTSRQPEVWVDADYSPDYGGWADNYRSTSA